MVIQEEDKPPARFVDSVRQSIREEVDKASSQEEKDFRFLKWVLTKVFNVTEDDADNQILEEPNDYGIDAFLEVEGDEYSYVMLFQSKYGKSHSKESILKFKEGVQKILELEPDQIQDEFLQDVRATIRDKNLEVESVYVTEQEEDFEITEGFSAYGFKQIVYKLWDDITESAKGKVDRIRLEKWLVYDSTIIGIVSLRELADFVGRTKKYVFESNIRKFLKGKTKVNKKLRKSLSEEPEDVFYYNNGITLVVKKFKESEDNVIELEEPQIVNGAQTSSTIYEVLKADPLIKGSVQVTIINETSTATRNQITRYRNSQNAVKGKDLISLERFHDSIHGQLKNLGYYYEQQAGSWINMGTEEKKRYVGDKTFNNYMPDDSYKKIDAKDAIQAMVAGIIQDPVTPYGSVGKFMPEGKHYAEVFKDGGIPDDYRLLFYPYLVKSYAEKEFGYGKRDTLPAEKKYARLLFVTAYFRILKDHILERGADFEKDPSVLDAIFKNIDANRMLLAVTDKILEDFFVLNKDIHKDEEGRDRMTLHTFFSKHVWGDLPQKRFRSLVNQRQKELRDYQAAF